MTVHDFDGLARRFRQLADDGIERILRNIAEAAGEALLNLIIDEIDKQNLIDTGALWQSFSRGEDGNVWEWDVDRNALVLEVGSNLPYAKYLNDGYTIEKAHFIPGYWNRGGSFVYDPSAKTGFLAKPRSFIGRRYLDIATDNFKGGMNEFIMLRLERELERMLGR
ncbi:HK97 gp10 family phage protein [Paenibacillus macerans]|uniref:HK97 gp10 family phage protein n=1 Tax=Paenibacillus macerans TaxID=44252 RepID=UPI00203FFCFF|nr:HK97 gp10 family phage protein [Paenibacillus macerans]MCM3699196.1 HK97 gp10 family phage protein [Paenibacillus macerans]